MAKKKAQKEDKAKKEEIFIVKTLEDYSEFCRTKKPTPIEKVLAIELLTHGMPFIPQFRIDYGDGCVCYGKKFCIVDFLLVLGRAWIVIETDGKQHYEEEVARYDKARSNFLTARGFYILRFDGSEILGDLDYVWTTIKKTIDFHMEEKNEDKNNTN